MLEPVSNVQKKPKHNVKHLVLGFLLALGIFGMGWLCGGGKIQFRGYQTVKENGKLPEKLDYSTVDTVYDSLRSNFDGKLDEAKLLDGLKAGLAEAAGDPYTEYFNSKDATEFFEELDGTFQGIGAELGKDADKNIIIISPIAGYPAEKAGLKPKDIIAEIDGKSAFDLTISEAVKMIRGDKGTKVKLTVVRDNKPVEVEVTREQITVPSVKKEIRGDVGILTISRFGDDTVKLAREAALNFKTAGVRGVVLDLRSNPGGLLDAAVDVSSLWLKNQVVLTERRDNVVIQTYNSRGTATLLGLPTVVLINEGSASASEITAGALKDNGVAKLYGQKTFGKGSVQQPVNLRDGSLLKVTIARWFTPAGKNIDKEGIEPDTKIEVKDEDTAARRDTQLEAALEQLKE